MLTFDALFVGKNCALPRHNHKIKRYLPYGHRMMMTYGCWIG